MKYKKIFFALFSGFLLFLVTPSALAHQPRIVKPEQSLILIENPELSQAFYDELVGSSKVYFINSPIDFDLYANLLVPKSSNPDGRYSALIYKINPDEKELIATLNATSSDWLEFYEEFASDTYLKGPEFKSQVPAGDYEIIVSNQQNQGKYVLAVGEVEKFGPKSILDAFYILPILKVKFFQTSVFKLLFPAKLGIMYWIALAILVFIVLAITCKVIKNRALKIQK